MGIVIKKSTRNSFIVMASISGLLLAIVIKFFIGGLDYVKQKSHLGSRADANFQVINKAHADIFDDVVYPWDNCGTVTDGVV